jgi:hypothetical protein
LKKPGGGDFKPKAGIYTFIRDSVNFQLLGEGGEYGTATPADVLEGKTIGTEDGVLPGTIPVNPSQTATLQITGAAKPTKVVPAGYTPGGTITAKLAASLASIILQGNTVGGVAGTLAPGKKWAAGSAAASSSKRAFTFVYSDGDYFGSDWRYVTIPGLSFTPSFIIVYRTGGFPTVVTYHKGALGTMGGTTIHIALLEKHDSGAGNNGFYFREDTTRPINSGSTYYLPVPDVSRTYQYIALE